MPPLPVGKHHDSRPLLPDDTCNLQTVFPGVFDSAIGDVESMAEGDFQNPGCLCCFTGAVLGRAASPHLPLRQIKDTGAVPSLRHLEQSAATCLLHIVAMRG